MKTSYVLLLLLFAAATTSLHSNAQLLLDINGDVVQTGRKYYMVSSIRGAGGGGVLPSTLPGVSSSCPSYVGWAQRDLNRGVPVIISSMNRPLAKSIKLNENVYIRFSEVDGCVKTPYWTLAGGGFLATGGSRPKFPPPAAGLDNAFSFAKLSDHSNSYRFAYCPCNVCLLLCYDVVRASVNGQNILKAEALTPTPSPPFSVYFVKAEEDEGFSPDLLRTHVSDD